MNETIIRLITSVLVLASLPPLCILTYDLIKQKRVGLKSDTVSLVLFIMYMTFLISGLITLYLNVMIVIYNIGPSHFIKVSLVRNIIKQIGIVVVSWRLYYLHKEGGVHK